MDIALIVVSLTPATIIVRSRPLRLRESRGLMLRISHVLIDVIVIADQLIQIALLPLSLSLVFLIIIIFATIVSFLLTVAIIF